MPLRPRVQLRPGGSGIFRVQRSAVGAELPLQQAKRVPAVPRVFNVPAVAKGRNGTHVLSSLMFKIHTA